MELVIKEYTIKDWFTQRPIKRYAIYIKTENQKYGTIRFERKSPTSYGLLYRYGKITIPEIEELVRKYDYFQYSTKVKTEKLLQELEGIAVVNRLTEV